MAQRLPSPPPVLPGFEHVHILGRGGFADVFLFEQSLPRRNVAVKVVLADLISDIERKQFRNEVDVMGRLSAHPNIVTIYSASVSDDGRPYLVMELCTTEVGARYREDPYDVESVLDIGIQIGSALDAVHAAGMLHRDLKPSNIMTTSYGTPVLSDFGIAAMHEQVDAPLMAVSVPWTAPEVLDESSNGSVAADVYAFGATLHSLLAGRSPAERPHASNRPEKVAERIRQGELDRLPSHVPVQLRTVIERALSRKAAERYASVGEMLAELRRAQTDLELAPTAVHQLVPSWEPMRRDAEEAPDDGAIPLRRHKQRRTRDSGLPGLIDVSTSSRPVSVQRRRRKRATWGLLVAGGSFAALAILAIVAVALSQLAGSIPNVETVTARPSESGVTFVWDDPGLVDSDSFLVRTSDGDAIIQSGTQHFMTGDPGEELCVTVLVNRDGSTGEGAEACGKVAQ